MHLCNVVRLYTEEAALFTLSGSHCFQCSVSSANTTLRCSPSVSEITSVPAAAPSANGSGSSSLCFRCFFCLSWKVLPPPSPRPRTAAACPTCWCACQFHSHCAQASKAVLELTSRRAHWLYARPSLLGSLYCHIMLNGPYKCLVKWLPEPDMPSNKQALLLHCFYLCMLSYLLLQVRNVRGCVGIPPGKSAKHLAECSEHSKLSMNK